MMGIKGGERKKPQKQPLKKSGPSVTDATDATKTTAICIKKDHLIKSGYTDLEHWLQSENHIYVGRDMSFYVKGATGSKWANPYTVKKFGLEAAIDMYKEYITNNKELYGSLSELKGKVLGCWCEPGSSCHAQILASLADNV